MKNEKILVKLSKEEMESLQDNAYKIHEYYYASIDSNLNISLDPTCDIKCKDHHE